MSAKAQPTTPRRTELPALVAPSFAALAAAAAVDELDADEDEDDELEEPPAPAAEEEVGEEEPVPFVEDDAPGLVKLEPLPYGAELEMPDALPVAEGRTDAVPEAFDGATGEEGAEPESADGLVMTSVSPSTMESADPVVSP